MKKLKRFISALMAVAMLLAFAPALTTANFGNTGGTVIIIDDNELDSVCHCGLPMVRQPHFLRHENAGKCLTHQNCNSLNRVMRDRMRCINTSCDTWIYVGNEYRLYGGCERAPLS